MDGKKEIKIASVLAGILFLVGVVAYAGFPQKAPEEPIRIMLKSVGGNVLFHHKQHVEDYGFECMDCHHTMDDNESKAEACGECHTPSGEDALRRADAFHQQCKGCHEEVGAPEECSGCHMLR